MAGMDPYVSLHPHGTIEHVSLDAAQPRRGARRDRKHGRRRVRAAHGRPTRREPHHGEATSRRARATPGRVATACGTKRRHRRARSRSTTSPATWWIPPLRIFMTKKSAIPPRACMRASGRSASGSRTSSSRAAVFETPSFKRTRRAAAWTTRRFSSSKIDTSSVRKSEAASSGTSSRTIACSGPDQQSNEDWFRENLSELQMQAARWNERGQPNDVLLRGEELAKSRSVAKRQRGLCHRIGTKVPERQPERARCDRPRAKETRGRSRGCST